MWWYRVYVVLCLVIGGACAAPLTQLQQTEAAFEEAKVQEMEKRAEAEKARAEEAQTEAARKAAAKAFAAAIQQDAEGEEARVSEIKARAEAARRRACELDPELCPKVAPPPQVQVPPAATPFPKEEEHIDIVIKADGTAEKRGNYPEGWLVVQEGDRLILRINGVESNVMKIGNFSPGCYRLWRDRLGSCSASL